MLRFGIDSFKRFDKYRLIWKLYLRGYRNVLRFYKELGFNSDYKNKKLEFVVYNYKKDSSLFDYVPFISDYVRSKTNSEFIMKTSSPSIAFFATTDANLPTIKSLALIIILSIDLALYL